MWPSSVFRSGILKNLERSEAPKFVDMEDGDECLIIYEDLNPKLDTRFEVNDLLLSINNTQIF